jgi:hypothetical protein
MFPVPHRECCELGERGVKLSTWGSSRERGHNALPSRIRPGLLLRVVPGELRLDDQVFLPCQVATST